MLRVRWIPSEWNVSDGPREVRALRGTTPQRMSTKRKQSMSSGEVYQETRTLKRQPSEPPPRKEKIHINGARKVVKKRVRTQRRNVVASFSVEDVPLGRGPNRSVDKTPEEEHQQRAREPIPSLPREVRGLLQGQRFAVAANKQDGLDPGRLLRHPLPGRPWSERWREVSRCRGVQVAPGEGHLASEQASATRVAKGSTSKEPVAVAQVGGLRYGHEDAELATKGHGTSPSVVFRRVPATWRGLDSQGKEPGVTGSWQWTTIPALCHRGPGRGRQPARQDGRLQQLASPGLSSNFKMVGPSPGEAQEGKEGERSPLQRQCREVPEGFRSSRRLAGLAYQLRHGGAADDLLTKTREYAAVKDRGRWRTDASVRRYGKVGKIQALLNKMPSWA